MNSLSPLRRFVRQSPLARPLRLARLQRIARTSGHEDWNALIGEDLSLWERLRDEARQGRRILIATSMGGHFTLNTIDRLLAVALTARGAAVTVGLCDGVMSACQMCEANLFPDQTRFAAKGPNPDLCSYCYAPSAEATAAIGLPVAAYGAELTAEDHSSIDRIVAATQLSAIREFTWKGIPVGEHALAGALRFFAVGNLNHDAIGWQVLQRYLRAALQIAMATDRLISRLRPEVVVAHHGIYVPQGIIAAIARRHGIRLVTWNPAYRKHCFLFSHDDTYHHTLMQESVQAWADRPLDEAEDSLITAYLRSRWQGDNDWIRFHKKPDFSLTKDMSQLGLDPSKPTIVALTNVFWDAQLHYPTNAFRTQRDWLVTTISWFASRPDLQLVIRIHPAEISGSPASRQFAADEIADAFPKLPDNVKVVPPDSALSTYDLAQHCDCAIIYATKTGVELTSMGIPVIVAGEAWIRNKGITIDATSEADYLALLEKLPMRKRLADELVDRAKRYAFHFFFRRMIPLEFIAAENGPRRFATRIRRLTEIMPGNSAGLDVICAGIVHGTPFHMPEQAAVDAAHRLGM